MTNTLQNWYNNYNLVFRNCQHFSNKSVLGLDVSNEITFFKKNLSLQEEMENVNRHFSNLSMGGDEIKDNRRKINDYFDRAKVSNLQQGFEAKIQVTPRSDCKIQ